MFSPIPLHEFERRTGAKVGHSEPPEKIVSLREVQPGTITSVQVMPRIYLERLLRNIVLEGDPSVRPYLNAEIKLVRLDPHDLRIGQTFVERPKYQSLLERFGSLLDESFCVTRGTAKCGPLIVSGKDVSGADVVAHYIPPIVEVNQGVQFLLDGVHRNFLVMRVGTTIESILLKGVRIPLPCDVRSWAEIRIVDEKPPRAERFYGLKPELFRNVKYAGIDG